MTFGIIPPVDIFAGAVQLLSKGEKKLLLKHLQGYYDIMESTHSRTLRRKEKRE